MYTITAFNAGLVFFPHMHEDNNSSIINYIISILAVYVDVSGTK